MRIAIVEKDAEMVAQLETSLVKGGHRCVHFCSRKQFICYLVRETVDLLLIGEHVADAAVSRMILRQRERHGSDVPTLLVTSSSSGEAAASAPKVGAQDYLAMPLHPEIVLAKIEAIWRRIYDVLPGHANLRRYGDYTFDLQGKSIRFRDRIILLTVKEFALALLLFQNMHRALSRSYIREAVWRSGVEDQSRTIDSHICKLRAKLSLRPENGYNLMSIYSYGYRLVALNDCRRHGRKCLKQG